MLPIKPTHDGVFIDIVDREITEKQLGNGKVLHLISDDHFGVHDPMSRSTHPGIRPRWARVLALGPDCSSDFKIGDLVLCDYGKWSRGFPLGRDGLEVVRIWRIKEEDIMVVDTDTSSEEYLQKFEEKLDRLALTIGRY